LTCWLHFGEDLGFDMDQHEQPWLKEAPWRKTSQRYPRGSHEVGDILELARPCVSCKKELIEEDLANGVSRRCLACWGLKEKIKGKEKEKPRKRSSRRSSTSKPPPDPKRSPDFEKRAEGQAKGPAEEVASEGFPRPQLR
jgi:hypothetical protein